MASASASARQQHQDMRICKHPPAFKETDVQEKENHRIGDTEATPLLVYAPFMLGLYDGRYENARAVLMPYAGRQLAFSDADGECRVTVAWLANGHVTDHQPPPAQLRCHAPSSRSSCALLVCGKSDLALPRFPQTGRRREVASCLAASFLLLEVRHTAGWPWDLTILQSL